MQGLKELFVVLFLALPIFVLARPFCVRYVTLETFDRRRNVWLGLTIVAFLAPSFWLYALPAGAVMWWLARRDENPHALVLMLLFLIPPLAIEIPTIGIGKFFELSQARLIGFCVLLPLALRILESHRRDPRHAATWTRAESGVAAYIALQLVLQLPYEDVTNSVRRAMLYVLDSLLVVYVMSRVPPERRRLVDVLLMFCLVGVIGAAVAAFENLRGWLLYPGINERWGVPNSFSWLLRGSELRAQASFGHALTCGYQIAMALCCWLYFARVDSRKRFIYGAMLILALGLLATHSRGPWLTAGLSLLLATVLGQSSASAVVRRLSWIALVCGLILVSPIGGTVIQKLPFVGEQDFNVTYRQQLIDLSMDLIAVNPLFGDPFVLQNMESLRQGQGIVDLVNAYLTVALFHGVVGLALYLSLFAIALTSAFFAWRRTLKSDAQMQSIGAVLLAAMIGTMFFMGTAGFAGPQYMLAGLLLSFARLVGSVAPEHWSRLQPVHARP